MAKYRQLHTSFWQDGFVLDLTPEEKYFYLYIMTNSKTSQCGIYELPKRIIETETGYNRETVQKLLQRFVDYKKIDYHEGTKELMINNWIKYNPPNNTNAIKCIVKELNEVKNLDFSILYIRLALESGYVLEGLARGLQGATDTLPSNKIINNKEEIKSNKEEVIIAEETSAAKESKKNITDNFTSNEELNQAIKDFKEMRKQIKKPMTEKAVKLMLNELNKLASDENTKIAILNQSIQNSWQGVFPLKTQSNFNKNNKPSSWQLESQRSIEPGLEEKLLNLSAEEESYEDPLEQLRKYREGK